MSENVVDFVLPLNDEEEPIEQFNGDVELRTLEGDAVPYDRIVSNAATIIDLAVQPREYVIPTVGLFEARTVYSALLAAAQHVGVFRGYANPDELNKEYRIFVHKDSDLVVTWT